MFGYVLPCKDKLSSEDLSGYQAAYCGLCHCLKKRYGFRARFLVNYDMTFLFFLLRDGERKQAERCFCPARVVCKKPCLPQNAVMDYAADLSVLLSYWKLWDAKCDGKFYQRFVANVGLWLYKKPWKRAAALRPEENQVFGEQLAKLTKLEQAQCPSLDRPADAFASLLRACALFHKEPEHRRVLELLLYHVGRYLYLVDALEDLPKDVAANNYNPLRFRYALLDGALSPEDKESLIATIDDSISMAASALELLPQTADLPILKNIIYYGLPTVLHSVAAGTFRKKGKR